MFSSYFVKFVATDNRTCDEDYKQLYDIGIYVNNTLNQVHSQGILYTRKKSLQYFRHVQKLFILAKIKGFRKYTKMFVML